jgi:hypothetical protein
MSNLTHSTGHGTGYGNATLLANPELCTLQTCDLSLASFLYLPTVVGNGLYAGIFGIFIFGQLYLGIKHRAWGYMIAVILGLVLELIGYVARVMLHDSPFNNNDFLMYLICLTIAPALLSASVSRTIQIVTQADNFKLRSTFASPESSRYLARISPVSSLAHIQSSSAPVI